MGIDGRLSDVVIAGYKLHPIQIHLESVNLSFSIFQ